MSSFPTWYSDITCHLSCESSHSEQEEQRAAVNLLERSRLGRGPSLIITLLMEDNGGSTSRQTPIPHPAIDDELNLSRIVRTQQSEG